MVYYPVTLYLIISILYTIIYNLIILSFYYIFYCLNCTCGLGADLKVDSRGCIEANTATVPFTYTICIMTSFFFFFLQINMTQTLLHPTYSDVSSNISFGNPLRFHFSVCSSQFSDRVLLPVIFISQSSLCPTDVFDFYLHVCRLYTPLLIRAPRNDALVSWHKG